jgi:hypothetical protein
MFDLEIFCKHSDTICLPLFPPQQEVSAEAYRVLSESANWTLVGNGDSQ